MRRSAVTGIGAYLPARVMTNTDLAQTVETSHEWIVERTGIEQRHLAADDEYTSDLGVYAAQAAMRDAGVTAADIDLIVLATTTPDRTMPATATQIQGRLGVTRGSAFDVNAACSGFIYAMTVADSLLQTGQATRALVIGAETFSRILDWNDRSTCILFGDGAGALVLEARENEPGGVLYTHIRSAGGQAELLATDGGVSLTKTAGAVFMQGKEIYRNAVAKMSEAVQQGLDALKLTGSDIDWLVPHQANARILASVAQKLELPTERVISTVAKHANTSAASIPLALDEARRDGRLKPGQLVVMTALGAGLTWGSCIVRL